MQAALNFKRDGVHCEVVARCCIKDATQAPDSSITAGTNHENRLADDRGGTIRTTVTQGKLDSKAKQTQGSRDTEQRVSHGTRVSAKPKEEHKKATQTKSKTISFPRWHPCPEAN